MLDQLAFLNPFVYFPEFKVTDFIKLGPFFEEVDDAVTDLINDKLLDLGPPIIPNFDFGDYPYPLGYKFFQFAASELFLKIYQKDGKCAYGSYEGVSKEPTVYQVLDIYVDIVTDEEVSMEGELVFYENLTGAAIMNPDVSKYINYLIVGAERQSIYLGGNKYKFIYDWVIVTDPFRLFTRVLARSPGLFNDNEAKIKEILEKENLDGKLGLNRMVYQDQSECTY